MIYLLDTDICSFVIKRSHPALIERLQDFAPGELKVSTVTVYELEYGSKRSNRHRRLDRVIRAFLGNVETLPLDDSAAREAGAIRVELERRGRVIGAYDLLIAGHARSLDAVLVTHNTGEFSRVADLRVEDWAMGLK